MWRGAWNEKDDSTSKPERNGSNVELTSNVVDPMEWCVAHVDVAGVSTRVSDAQTPEEHLLPQQSVQSVREGVMRIHPTKKHDVACSDMAHRKRRKPP